MSGEPSETYFYVRRRGRISGPWTSAKVISEIRLRKLGRRDEISVDGQKWLPAGDFTQFFPDHAPAPGQATAEVPTENTVTHNIPESELEDWYVMVNDEQVGPMSLEDLLQMARVGSLTLDDLVWKETFPDWLELERVPELMSQLEATDDPSEAGYDVTGATRLVATAPEPAPPLSKMAFYGMISGLALIPGFCCIFWAAGLLGLVPIVLSVMGLLEIRDNPSLSGKGYAITGIILGGVYVLLGITLLILTVVGVIAIPYLSDQLPWLN